jgi:hypothetical protein
MRELNQEIMDEYEKIKDKISYEEFLKKMDEYKEENADVSFIDDISIAQMVVGNYITEKKRTHPRSKGLLENCGFRTWHPTYKSTGPSNEYFQC